MSTTQASFGYPAKDPLEEVTDRLRKGLVPDSDDIGLLLEATRTVQRAFSEIDKANTVLDDVSDLGHQLLALLTDSLARHAREEIPSLLGSLRSQAMRVERSEAVRTVANRILGNDDDGETEALEAVPALTAELLPRVPSLYDDEEQPGSTLADLWERQERLERVQDRVRRERLERVAAHLVSLTDKIVSRSFMDTRFTRAVLDEMERAYGLWCECLDEQVGQ
jgi:hypothetical protein